jgi:hypothetical protein
VDATSLTSLPRTALHAATWVSVGYGDTYGRARGAPVLEQGGDRLATTTDRGSNHVGGDDGVDDTGVRPQRPA